MKYSNGLDSQCSSDSIDLSSSLSSLSSPSSSSSPSSPSSLSSSNLSNSSGSVGLVDFSGSLGFSSLSYDFDKLDNLSLLINPELKSCGDTVMQPSFPVSEPAIDMRVVCDGSNYVSERTSLNLVKTSAELGEQYFDVDSSFFSEMDFFDKESALNAVFINGLNLRYCSYELRLDYSIIKAAMDNTPKALKFVTSRQIVLRILREDGMLLEHVCEEFKLDKAIIKLAMESAPEALNFVTSIEVVKDIVSENGLLLQYANDMLCSDITVIEKAVANNKYAYKFASGEMRTPETCLYLLEKFNEDNDVSYIFCHVMSVFKSDVCFITRAVVICPDIFKYIYPNFKSNIEVLKFLIWSNPMVFDLISEDAKEKIKNNAGVLESIVDIVPGLYKTLGNDFALNEDIALKALQGYPNLYKDMDLSLRSSYNFFCKMINKKIAKKCKAFMYAEKDLLKNPKLVANYILSCDLDAIDYIDESLKNNHYLFRLIINIHPELYVKVSKNLWSDLDFVLSLFDNQRLISFPLFDNQLFDNQRLITFPLWDVVPEDILRNKGVIINLIRKSEIDFDFVNRLWPLDEDVAIEFLKKDINIFSRLDKKLTSKKSFCLKAAVTNEPVVVVMHSLTDVLDDQSFVFELITHNVNFRAYFFLDPDFLEDAGPLRARNQGDFDNILKYIRVFFEGGNANSNLVTFVAKYLPTNLFLDKIFIFNLFEICKKYPNCSFSMVEHVLKFDSNISNPSIVNNNLLMDMAIDVSYKAISYVNFSIVDKNMALKVLPYKPENYDSLPMYLREDRDIILTVASIGTFESCYTLYSQATEGLDVHFNDINFVKIILNRFGNIFSLAKVFLGDYVDIESVLCAEYSKIQLAHGEDDLDEDDEGVYQSLVTPTVSLLSDKKPLQDKLKEMIMHVQNVISFSDAEVCIRLDGLYMILLNSLYKSDFRLAMLAIFGQEFKYTSIVGTYIKSKYCYGLKTNPNYRAFAYVSYKVQEKILENDELVIKLINIEDISLLYYMVDFFDNKKYSDIYNSLCGIIGDRLFYCPSDAWLVSRLSIDRNMIVSFVRKNPRCLYYFTDYYHDIMVLLAALEGGVSLESNLSLDYRTLFVCLKSNNVVLKVPKGKWNEDISENLKLRSIDFCKSILGYRSSKFILNSNSLRICIPLFDLVHSYLSDMDRFTLSFLFSSFAIRDDFYIHSLKNSLLVFQKLLDTKNVVSCIDCIEEVGSYLKKNFERIKYFNISGVLYSKCCNALDYFNLSGVYCNIDKVNKLKLFFEDIKIDKTSSFSLDSSSNLECLVASEEHDKDENNMHNDKRQRL